MLPFEFDGSYKCLNKWAFSQTLSCSFAKKKKKNPPKKQTEVPDQPKQHWE